MCLPGLSLVVSALCRWPCSISILLSPRSVTGVSLSVGHEAFPFICLLGPSLLVPCSISFLFICLSGLSLLVSAPFCWPCSISIRLSPSLHCWCPPLSVGHEAFLLICFPGPLLPLSALFRWPCSISIHLSPLVSALFVGHAAFLFISLPGLSLLVSALFRWRCNISIHLFSRSVTAGVRPVPLGMQHFYSFVSRVCHWCCRPFPLVM